MQRGAASGRGRGARPRGGRGAASPAGSRRSSARGRGGGGPRAWRSAATVACGIALLERGREEVEAVVGGERRGGARRGPGRRPRRPWAATARGGGRGRSSCGGRMIAMHGVCYTSRALAASESDARPAKESAEDRCGRDRLRRPRGGSVPGRERQHRRLRRQRRRRRSRRLKRGRDPDLRAGPRRDDPAQRGRGAAALHHRPAGGGRARARSCSSPWARPRTRTARPT